jgi:hypothetical protein
MDELLLFLEVYYATLSVHNILLVCSSAAGTLLLCCFVSMILLICIRVSFVCFVFVGGNRQRSLGILKRFFQLVVAFSVAAGVFVVPRQAFLDFV